MERPLYEEITRRPAKMLAQDAVFVQDACNLSGVVFSFAEIMHALCQAANELNKGTDWKNNHPICVMFASKIGDLAGRSDGVSFGRFDKAFTWCKEVSEQGKDEWDAKDFDY